MSDLSTVVAVYATHVEAQEAVKQLERGGINIGCPRREGKRDHRDHTAHPVDIAHDRSSGPGRTVVRMEAWRQT